MKKTVLVTILFILMAFFGGCNAGDGQENNNIADVITNIPSPVEPEEIQPWVSATGQNDPTKEEVILKKRKLIEEKISTLETMDRTELDLYADKEISLLNSNVLHNYGYLAYDQAGIIYFADRNIGGIFASDWDGKNRRQLTPDSGKNLQVVGEWLYYLSTGKTGIWRIHLETGETDVVWEQDCEAFILWKNRLYINGFDGFYVTEPDGTNEVVLHDQSLMLHQLQLAGDGLWLGNAFNENDYAFMLEGHLISYDATENTWYYMEDGAQDPLLAGNWLCVREKRTGKHMVWDLETDIMTELNLNDNSCVSDGINLYISFNHTDSPNVFYRWNGGEKEELFRLETDMYVHHKYLTPDRLYWMQTDEMEEWLWEFWYYDLESKEIVQIY